MSDAYFHTFSSMGTVVTIQIVGPAMRRAEFEAAAMRAAAWFEEIESRCTRFDPSSELMQLCARVGEVVVPSPALFQAVQFAVAVAAQTDGAFDPTVGARMESLGFNEHHRTGVRVRSSATRDATFNDVYVDAVRQSITIRRPLVLDLGAVAKGLALDVAARELEPFENFAIDAGGDLYLGGHNAEDRAWTVGIRHPRDSANMIDQLAISGMSVCTSGDYERLENGAHHILDARTGEAARDVISTTVIAPSAIVADALATAAFVLGPLDGLALLHTHGVHGMIVTPSLERFETPNFASWRRPSAEEHARAR